MPKRASLLAVLLAAVAAAPALAADSPPPPPADLHGSYDAYGKATTLAWSAPAGSASDTGDWVYRVWRDDRALGKAWATTYRDAQLPTEAGWVYLVTASPDGGLTWSEPALAGVASVSCEVVTVSSTWSYPYLHVRLHEECIGGLVFDKEFDWSQGA